MTLKTILLEFHLSIHPPIRPSIQSSIYPSTHPPTHLPTYMPVCLSVCLSVVLTRISFHTCQNVPPLLLSDISLFKYSGRVLRYRTTSQQLYKVPTVSRSTLADPANFNISPAGCVTFH